MFRFNPKQRLAIKSWAHAAIATESYALVNFAQNYHSHFTLVIFAKAAGAALLAPITRWLAASYSKLAILYPWLKPLANKIVPMIKAKFGKKAPVAK